MHTPMHTQGKIPMERGGLLLCLNILASDQVVKRNYKLHSLCHMAICKYLISQKDKRKEGKRGRKETEPTKPVYSTTEPVTSPLSKGMLPNNADVLPNKILFDMDHHYHDNPCSPLPPAIRL